MANFPTSLDNGTSLPNPTSSSTTNNPSHAGLHASENAAIIAAETKLGTGSTTPTANTLLFGTGTGTSAWQGLTSAQLASVLSDETGTGSAVFATTPTLITPKIDTINENTPSNGTTVGGINMKSGAIATSSSVPTAALQDASVTSAKAATGFAVQQVDSLTTAVATGTTTLPSDDTIPQITEGDQYLSVAITPKSTTNKLVITATLFLTHSITNQNMTAALFQDSTANALAVGWGFNSGAGSPLMVHVYHSMTAGTTSSTTFKIRAGGQSAGTTTLNGSGGVRFFGAITKSSISITEYKS